VTRLIVRAATNVSVGDQHSDAGIGYRDEAPRFVIGMLWDSAAHLKFLHRERQIPSRNFKWKAALES
jgi:hypothetical protein